MSASKVRTFLTKRLLSKAALSLALMSAFSVGIAWADVPPIRIAVVPGGGSGIEQDVVDRISGQLEMIDHVVVSTVNPDWYCVCNVQERMDQMSGQIRYNGTVTVKTTDGQVISNVAVQKYNQDFSLTPGAPLNKALVDKAAHDVIDGLAERAVTPIQQAVQTEVDTREHMSVAMGLAESGRFDEAIAALQPVTPDSTHFRQVQGAMGQFQIEKQAIGILKAADAQAKKGNLPAAISTLKSVDKHSRFYKMAQDKAGGYRATLARAAAAKLAKNKANTAATVAKGTTTSKTPAKATPGMAPEMDVQALERTKQALETEKQAIEARESAIEMQHAIDGQGQSQKK